MSYDIHMTLVDRETGRAVMMGVFPASMGYEWRADGRFIERIDETRSRLLEKVTVVTEWETVDLGIREEQR